MGTHLTDDEHVALFDSVTGWAFGTTFGSREMAEDFLDWIDDVDPRGLSLNDLGRKQSQWLRERTELDGEGYRVLRPRLSRDGDRDEMPDRAV